MNLKDVIARAVPPQGKNGGNKIPWHEEGFSRRMLASHLAQDHDWASRRAGIIKKHAACIGRWLPAAPARVLDLGCGPGLYVEALCRAGHQCAGVDFSPASIAYAR